MSAEILINAALLADAGVMALVLRPGGDPAVDARIYPDFLAQEIALPGIVNIRADTEYVNTIHSGVAIAARISMESWCLAASRVDAEQLADTVEAALPVADFRIIGRRPEFNEETLTYASVVTSEIWT